MLRLQRILFHRELGVHLGEIAGLLDMEGADQVGVLLRHREKLEAERERFRVLIDTIDRTVADIKGETPMPNADLYKGFSAEKTGRIRSLADRALWRSDEGGHRALAERPWRR